MQLQVVFSLFYLLILKFDTLSTNYQQQSGKKKEQSYKET